MIWKCGKYAFDTRMPIIMGILNVTPDSFSDGGKFNSFDAAIEHAHDMKEQGALIIDVGGESTRSGSKEVSEAEELSRVIDVVRALAAEDICVSVDTRHASVAKACVEAGASIINDVSGFRDPAMREVAASCDAGLVVMHMQGEPETMQDNPTYSDVVTEVYDSLSAACAELESMGVAHERICIDPGPGFGKTVRQTKELMRNLHELRHMGYPIMCAASRKSYVGYVYDIEDPMKRDAASAAEALLACELGASIVRTHNVEMTRDALKDLRPYVLIGIGGNLALVANDGEEKEGIISQLNSAIGNMMVMPDTLLIDNSPWYVSEPAYDMDQDPFVNGVVLLRSGLPPQELLNYLHTIEDSLGRVRTRPNGPRTCDLDILDYQGYVSDLDILKLPHPLILERDFVVKPLLDILPGHILANNTPVTVDNVTVGAAVRYKQGM